MKLMSFFKRGQGLVSDCTAERMLKEAEAREAEARAEARRKHDETWTAERVFELRRDEYNEEMRLLIKLGYSVPAASREAARRVL